MPYIYRKTARNSLGQFLRSRERMVHGAAPIIRNPKAVIAEARTAMIQAEKEPTP